MVFLHTVSGHKKSNYHDIDVEDHHHHEHHHHNLPTEHSTHHTHDPNLQHHGIPISQNDAHGHSNTNDGGTSKDMPHHTHPSHAIHHPPHPHQPTKYYKDDSILTVEGVEMDITPGATAELETGPHHRSITFMHGRHNARACGYGFIAAIGIALIIFAIVITQQSN